MLRESFSKRISGIHAQLGTGACKRHVNSDEHFRLRLRDIFLMRFTAQRTRLLVVSHGFRIDENGDFATVTNAANRRRGSRRRRLIVGTSSIWESHFE